QQRPSDCSRIPSPAMGLLGRPLLTSVYRSTTPKVRRDTAPDFREERREREKITMTLCCYQPARGSVPAPLASCTQSIPVNPSDHYHPTVRTPATRKSGVSPVCL